MRFGWFVAGLLLFIGTGAAAEDAAMPGPTVKVAVVTILTGDLGVLGKNVMMTAETYRKHYLRHDLKFVYEDARLSSVEGLRAYQKVIKIDRADVIVGACSSNGTMAAKELINSSKTPTVTVVTGGRNIDQAGPYVFRVGNSDTLNGYQEAEYFVQAGQKRVALLAEETEYTQDIKQAFVDRFAQLGGTLSFHQDFLPGTSDFRSEVSAIKKSAPEAIFMPTQTGTALGIFLKQWQEQGASGSLPIHTTFVAAPNADARAIAGDSIYGVYYMAPEYDRENPELKKFFEFYRQDNGTDPAIPFHTAGTVDTLNLVQLYLDQHRSFDREDFQRWLSSSVKNYHGLMGTYSFDAEGNADLGFKIARIQKSGGM